MNPRVWSLLFLLIVLSIMIFIATINYFVDPGNIYYKHASDNRADQYVAKLISSPHGLVSTGWNEREVKKALAKRADQYDCFIVGSSHIMQFSSVRNTPPHSMCLRSLNLGVSGGSLEDIAALTNIILDSNQSLQNKRLLIGIDPWTLKFGMDERSKILQSDWEVMNRRLNQMEKRSSESYIYSKFQNLFNSEYFISSLKTVYHEFKQPGGESPSNAIKSPSSLLSYDEGYREPLFLSDGSLVYSSKYISEQSDKIKQLPIGGGDYKIQGDIYDPSAIEYFIRYIRLCKQNGLKISLITTPYHPNVFKTTSKSVSHLREMELTVDRLAQELNISRYGSFFPHKVGCKENEFYDFMHAKKSCLDKIDVQENK